MKALVALVLVMGGVAGADPLRVVVRHGGDARALERLPGQLSDLDVEVIDDDGALEKTVDAQIAAATRLADDDGATVVVWFRRDGKATVVAVATPADRRVFLRTIDAGDASATAEAAAQSVRSALQAIALGGTIGVAVEQVVDAEPPHEPTHPPPPPVARVARATPWQWSGAAGWQVDLDGGAEAGAHAIAQRLGVAHGAFGGALALSLGPPLRKNASGVAVDLSRSSVLGEAELRWRDFRFGLGAGVAIYHRATVDVPGGLMATDSQVQAALDVAPEVRWIGRLRGASWGIEITAGVDVVIGAPRLVVENGTSQTTLAELATFQPRFGLGLVVGR